MDAPHVFSHLCREFSPDYVTLTFGSRREGSAPNRELNQTNLCLNLKGGRSSRRELTHIPMLDKFKNTRVVSL